MTKLERVRELLKKALLSFERISTDKALIESDDDEIVVGSSVFGIDEEGNRFDLENGEYRADDGTVYVVEDGKVIEIRDPETSETTGDDVQPEDVTEEIENTEVEEEAETPEEEDPRDERIRNLEAEVARLETENGELRERIAELENKPAAFSAAEDFEHAETTPTTGDAKLDRLVKRFSK